jgi:hypothetical protein
MNSIQKPWVEKNYPETIKNLEYKIAQAAIDGDNESIRILIDMRRQVLSDVLRENERLKHGKKDLICFDPPTPEIGEFIQLWCNRIKTYEVKPIYFADEEYCHHLIDAILPEHWDWQDDLLVLAYPFDKTIFEALLARGQKRIAVFGDEEQRTKLIKVIEKFDDFVFNDDPVLFKAQIAGLRSRVSQTLVFNCNPARSYEFNSEAITELANAGRNLSKINVNTLSMFGEDWANNIIENIHHMATKPRLGDLEVSGACVAVVISPGPSLTKNIGKLARYKEKVFTIATSRALPILENHNFIPDLTIQLDSVDKPTVERLMESPPSNINLLLLEGRVPKEFFSLKSEKTLWNLVATDKVEGVASILNSSHPNLTAPGVSIYGVLVAQQLGFKNICLVGQDLAFGETGDYYAPGGEKIMPDNIPLEQLPENEKCEVRGFWGGKVTTRYDYALFIDQFSDLCMAWKKVSPDMKLVNTTEGGAYIPKMRHMRLEKFLKNYCEIEKSSNTTFEISDQNNTKLSELSKFCFKNLEQLQQVTILSKEIVKLENLGTLTPALAKKRDKLVKKVSKINSENCFLELALQETINRAAVSSNTQGVSTGFEGSIYSFSEFFQQVHDKSKKLAAAMEAQMLKLNSLS